MPEHLVIVGGSYIGLEFAQMMRRFGAAVSVVEHAARLLPHEDEDVSDGIRAILENEGIRLALGAVGAQHETPRRRHQRESWMFSARIIGVGPGHS